MIDINLLRDEKTRNLVIESEKKRFKDPNIVTKASELDRLRITQRYNQEQLSKEINQLQNEIKLLYKSNKKEEAQILVNKSKNLKDKRDELDNEIEKSEKELKYLLKQIGNILHQDVVVSKNEEENKLIASYRTKRIIYGNLGYDQILEKIGGCDTARGSRLAGHRGYYLMGETALLANALSRYAIDFLREKGFKLVQPPVFMNKDAMTKTCQLSEFDEQLYAVENDLYLIATSEQPLSALHMNERLLPSQLPLLYSGQSLCFRKEAGAHGKDNAGIFRVHQFEKIEQFVICDKESSQMWFEKMIRYCQEFYESLDISYNVVSIVSGEMNDAASIKYDLEAFFPNTNRFRELVSCSNCTDFQSRSLEVRYGVGKEDDKKVYVHMLNCTMCAIQRTLCCILENYQKEDRVVIPRPLRKYFDGEFIIFKE
ncbi:Serine--tRNA ligase [Astathelohania contejeani]|uniref:serine--tRNA ligase n=1 Tax=Astathelohania contejeani TaxID=164912 RepID=A0ABQ7HW39_9MICR|nr:Serine--tRNA ligase [Thelohania contejeani]